MSRESDPEFFASQYLEAWHHAWTKDESRLQELLRSEFKRVADSDPETAAKIVHGMLDNHSKLDHDVIANIHLIGRPRMASSEALLAKLYDECLDRADSSIHDTAFESLKEALELGVISTEAAIPFIARYADAYQG